MTRINLEFGELYKHGCALSISSLKGYVLIGLTILYNKQIYCKRTLVESLIHGDILRTDLISSLVPLCDFSSVVMDGLPLPFCKMISSFDVADLYQHLSDFSNQELVILAEFFTVCDSISANNVKNYMNLVSQLLNRNKKEMFGMRGWRNSYYIHLIPLRDLTTSQTCIMVFGELFDIPSFIFTRQPFIFPYKHFDTTDESFWLDHPSYSTRDIRFKTFRYGNPLRALFYSFYTPTPSVNSHKVMLDIQSGHEEYYSLAETEDPETKETTQVASFESQIPPPLSGHSFSKQETSKRSLESINRQITNQDKKTKWENDEKLKTLASKFFG